MIECSLGIDLGTSGVKTAVMTRDGEVRAVTDSAYAISSPHRGWAQIDPAEWEDATRRAVAAVLAAAPDARVVSVGIDGQMHGAVLVDSAGEAVREAILWPDTRAEEQVAGWAAFDDATIAALANPLAAGMAGPMVAWLCENEPESVRRAARLLSPKDWLRCRLVPGSLVTDPSDASAGLLWDVVADGWNRAVVHEAGLPERLLAPVEPSDAVAGTISAEIARTWGIPAGVPVSVGCSDVAGTVIGSRAPADRLTITVGTGGQILLPHVAPEPTRHPRFHVYRRADDGYYAMAAVVNAGLALGRVMDVLGATWTDLYGSLAESPSADDCTFLPLFSGERVPRVVTASNAGWQGMGLDTDRSAMLRAAVEGVVFVFRRAAEALPRSADEIDLLGGGTRDPAFQQFFADAFERPVRRRSIDNVTAVGAAMLGWLTLGDQPNAPREPDAERREPRDSPALRERYARFLARVDGL